MINEACRASWNPSIMRKILETNDLKQIKRHMISSLKPLNGWVAYHQESQNEAASSDSLNDEDFNLDDLDAMSCWILISMMKTPLMTSARICNKR